MRLKQTFFIIFFLFLLVWGVFAYTPLMSQNLIHERCTVESVKMARVEQIDKQIEELENLKRGYLSKANRLDDQAERLQFQDRSFLESRRFSELADENRQKAERTPDEIDRLKKEKENLLGKPR